MTTDMAAAERFFCDVVEWPARQVGQSMPDTAVTIREAPAAGLTTLPDAARAEGGSSIVQGLDPQAVFLAFVSPRE